MADAHILTYDEMVDALDKRQVLTVAVSHEALRDQLAAMTAVAKRLLDGWAPSEIVDDEGLWTKGLIPDGYEAEHEEWMTAGERAALDALEADDGG